MLDRTIFWPARATLVLASSLLSLVAACGPSGGNTDGGAIGDGGVGADTGADAGHDAGSTTIPTVISTNPAASALGVPINTRVSATFSEEMDAASLTATTFTVTSSAGPVVGTVFYGHAIATFSPTARLAPSTTFTATITTGATSASAIALASPYTWMFTTGDTLAPTLPVDLGTSGDYVILAKSGISTVPTSAITGDLGLSPAAASFITGFSLSADATNAFATSPQVTGHIFAADYAPATPTVLTTAVGDMLLAFADAAGRAPDVTELGAGDIGGMTLTAGVYEWGTGLLIPTDVTLTGSATDVWIFQIAQDLTVSSAVQVHLSGGALPQNVFWQVSGAVDFGTTSHGEGIILCQTAINLRTGASINGRLLAQTAVTLDANAIVQPTP